MKRAITLQQNHNNKPMKNARSVKTWISINNEIKKIGKLIYKATRGNERRNQNKIKIYILSKCRFGKQIFRGLKNKLAVTLYPCVLKVQKTGHPKRPFIYIKACALPKTVPSLDRTRPQGRTFLDKLKKTKVNFR